MKKSLKTLLFLTFFLPASRALAEIKEYQVLTPIPGLQGGTVPTTGGDLAPYLNNLYTMGVAAAAGLAVIMVIWGGVEYITAVAGEGKSGGKERITSAILGLLLALGSYIILNTINPDLLKLSFNLKPADIKIDASAPTAGGLDPYVDDFSNTTGMNTGYAGGSDFNNFNSLPSDSNGNVTFSAYGYAGDDTPDYNSSHGIGNNANQLTPGSVALSQDLISSLNPVHGAAVLVNGKVVGYYDDRIGDASVTNRIDRYDPSASLGGNNFLKKTNGTISVDNNNIRQQTHVAN